jgi:hypothetical protein
MRVGTRRWLYHRSINVFSLPQTTLLSSRMPNTQPVAKPSHTSLDQEGDGPTQDAATAPALIKREMAPPKTLPPLRP